MIRLATFATILTGMVAVAPAIAAPKHGELVMAGGDQGHATYADKCSNGKNSDAPTRDKFVAAALADKTSKLGKVKKELEKAPDTAVVVGPWTQTFNNRIGCETLSTSYSAILSTKSTMGSGHELAAKYIVTIDDDVEADQRTFSIRTVEPFEPRTAGSPNSPLAVVVEGDACPSGTDAVTDTKISVVKATLSFSRDRGGGCRTAPVYTAVYKKGDPMAVRVCYAYTADRCDMVIHNEQVSIDLGEALRAAGATSAKLVR